MGRAEASNEATLLLQDGESATLPFSVSADGAYGFLIRYSNDNAGALENVTVLVDGTVVGVFQPADTGDDGEGWNMFADSQALGPARLTAGPHELTFAVAGGDGYSVELDVVRSA